MPKFTVFLAALVLLCMTPRLEASPEGAKAAYLRGAALERAKDYKNAIVSYREALAEDSRYVYANKQMGNCYYYLGDKIEALANYDLWLAVKKDDTATAAFAEKLRAEVSPQAPYAVDDGYEPEPEDRPRRRNRRKAAPLPPGPLSGSSFYMGASMSGLFGNAGDIKKAYAGSSYEGLTYVDFGLNFDAHLGFLFEPGLGIEAGVSLLSRAVQASYVYRFGGNYYSDYDLYSILETTYFVEPLWRFPFSRKLGLIAGVKLGYATASFKNSTYNYSSNGANTFNGSGTLIAPDLRLQILFGGRVSLEVGGEYRFSDIGPMKNSLGTALQVYNDAGELEDWRVSNSGIALRIGLNIYFSRLTAAKAATP